MENAKMSLKSLVSYIKINFANKMNEIFSSRKKTIQFLAVIVFTILFLIQIGIMLINNSFYNNFSDDILQYYSIITDFITQIKDGSISWYNLNNYLGASFFSDIYYVPLDIFTFITFILSYIMPVGIAYSITELLKIFLGVLTLAYYLSITGKSNRTVFWMGIIYFVSGGSVSFMAFPVFLSLAFYLPLGLLVIHFFFKGKWYFVPLYALLLVFYDFYLGYMALAFVSIMFVVESFKIKQYKWYRFIGNGIFFLFLLLLGVAMSMVILYPSILFILEDTYRPTGSFDSWTLTIGSIDLKLFQPSIYLRVLAKIFTEQKPIGFYGFENNYGQEHISLFITIVGFVYMTYIFAMKDRTARVYQILILVGVLLVFFPIFSFVFSGTMDSPYTRWINVYPLVEILILAHVFEEYGFEKVKMKYLTISIVLLLVIDAFLMRYYIIQLSTDENYISRDVLTADTVLMGVAGLFMILIVVFGWLKKFKVIKAIFWIEFVVALVYIYSGPFSIRNKIDTFDEMGSINEFLNEVLDDEDFYRVYVDLDRFDVEKFNFNRMTTFPTNTKIFHSWTDSETNMISYLLFGTNEYQTKEKLEVQAIYLNQVLGYKYLLVSSEYSYYLPNSCYEMKYANSEYKLYEIKNAQGFQVYESYVEYDEFRNFSTLNSKIAAQKLLLLSVLIDREDERFDYSNLNMTENNDLQNSMFLKSVTSYQTTNQAELVLTQGLSNTAERNFYKYNAFDISFDTGAIYIKSTYMNLAAFGEVFMEFEDGHRQSCSLSTGDGDTDYQVKCEFWEQPTSIYFEETTNFNSNKKLEYRLERAIDGAAYLVYSLSDIDFENDEGMLFFSLSSSISFERVFVEDDKHNQIEAFNGYLYYNSIPQTMFVLKTSSMYEQKNLFTLSLKYVYDDLSDYESLSNSNLVDNQSITINNGSIHLSYNRISQSANDQMIMIPIAYSEEWIITSNTQYETYSVSGGFLGILIPADVDHVDVTLKFVPKGLSTGSIVSISSVFIYSCLVVVLPMMKKKNKKSGDEIK